MAEFLRKIGWDVWTSLEEGRARNVQDAVWSRISDAQQLIASRTLDRILTSFDAFRGRDGAEVAAELKLHGGKVVQIVSGSQQSTYRSVAKLLWHCEEWTNFLQTNDGVVVLSDLRQQPKCYTVDEYNQKPLTLSSRQYFDDYMAHWRERQLPKPIPKPKLTPEEQALMSRLPEDPQNN